MPANASSHAKTLIVIPTYNELSNLPGLLQRIRDHCPGIHVLVVDDSSPDGTGQWVSENAGELLHVMIRPAKSGLASAYCDGFRWGIERDFEYLVEMDADGSHRVVDLTKLLVRAYAEDAPDLVIGSRWINGGATPGWAPHRIALSRAGNLYIRAWLGMRAADATAGFRVYRSALAAQLIDGVISTGYGFQVEMTWLAHGLGAKIVEVPITFLERRAGESKMDGSIIVEELVQVTKWGAKHRARQLYQLFTKRS